jgi:uncharacterized damage-inducible protein DinB
LLEEKEVKLDRLFAHWTEVRGGLLAIIDKFDDAELAYRPFDTSWSAGQVMLHIANAEEGWFRCVVTRELAEWPSDYTLETYPTVEAIKALLTEVHGRTSAYLTKLTLADLERSVEASWGETLSLGWVIWHVLEHEIHHRGELSLILGLLGREGAEV